MIGLPETSIGAVAGLVVGIDILECDAFLSKFIAELLMGQSLRGLLPAGTVARRAFQLGRLPGSEHLILALYGIENEELIVHAFDAKAGQFCVIFSSSHCSTSMLSWL